MKKNYAFKFTLLFVIFLLHTKLSAQQTYTFTNASNSGRFGPTQTQINTAYFGGNLQGKVTVVNGIQTFTVPPGVYRIDAYGAQGGTSSTYAGGFGARMRGDFTITTNSTLN